MKEGLRSPIVLLLLAALCVAPGFACTVERADRAAEEPPVEAAAPEEAAPAATPAVAETVDDGRSVAARLADASTAARIRKALVAEQSLRRFDFEPVVEQGRVTLQGTVQTAEQRARAAEVARGVEGVRAVANALDATEAPGLAAETPPPAPTSAPSQPAEPQQPAPTTAAPQPETKPAETKKPEPEKASGEVFHTVRSGESLWTISQQYGVTVDQINRLNNLRSNNLQPNQKIRVK